MMLKFNLWPVGGQDVLTRKAKVKVDGATGEIRDDNDIPY